VAFLPVAFVMLLVTIIGKGHIFEWVHEPPTQPEKALWLDPTFWSVRTALVFALITWLSVWFVYTAVRLDVGVLPEWGANWAKGIRARMRAGFGEERRELHSTHSLQGKLAVFMVLVFGFGWVVLSWDLSMSIDPHFQSTMYGWQFFMGGWLCNLMLMAAPGPRMAQPDGRRSRHHRFAFPRHRQVVLRLHGVLGVPHVQPAARHLVRQHGGGNALLPRTTH
jgi:hypothetical protein